jgi:hypothetical protein
MICENCKMAGEFNAHNKPALAQAKHQECEKGCVCQHKVGPEYVAKAKVKPMQVQSP